MGLPSPRGLELRRRQGGALEAQGQPYQAPTRPHLNQSRLQRPYLRSRSHSQGSRWCGFRGTLVTPTQTVEICSPRLEGPAAQRGPPARLGARSAGGQPLRGQAWPAPGPRLPATRRERRDPASRSGAFAAAMLRIPETRNSPDVHPLMIDGKTVVSPRGGASLGRGRTLNTGRSGRDADAQGHAACDPVDVTRPGVSPTGGG